MTKNGGLGQLYKTEDYWAVWLGLLVIFAAMATFWGGGTLKGVAATPGTWADGVALLADLTENALPFLVIFLGFGIGELLIALNAGWER